MRGVIQKDPSFGAPRALMVILCAGAGLAACATAGPRPHYVVSGPPPAAAQPPNPSGLHGTMAPYQVNGRWYTPHAEPGYDVVGVASWYGQQFHNHRTANGEIFDQNAVSAAHTTLPIPSIIEVTNLANNKTIRVRLNDRGPFVDGRILDLSREAAAELGYEREGVARVRIRYIGPAPALPTVRLAANSASDETPRRGTAPHHAGEIADQDFPTVAGAGGGTAAPTKSGGETADIEDGPTTGTPASSAAAHGHGLAVRDGVTAGAGAYAVQGRAAAFISHLSGSYSGIMGLPMFETAALLRGFGFTI